VAIEKLEVFVDFVGDGLYAGGNDNVTANVIDIPHYSRGRSEASLLVGRSIAGSATVRLNNPSGLYNSFNAGGALFGKILPRRRVKILSADPFPYTFPFLFHGTPLWAGYLDKFEADPQQDGNHRTILTAVGIMALLAEAPVLDIAPQSNITTDAALVLIMAAVGISTSDYSFQAGDTTMTRWFPSGNALQDVRDIEETEGGFIHEDAQGRLIFENRQFRLSGTSLISKATLSDVLGADIPINHPQQGDPWKDIYNIFRAKVPTESVGSLATLWTLFESGASSPKIGPGGTRTWEASYPLPATARETIGVDAWTTLVATTDYIANSLADGTGTNLTSSMSVVLTKGLTTLRIAITNGAAVEAFITKLQARGTPLASGAPAGVVATDTGSITKFNEREFPSPAKFLPNTTEAENYVRFRVAVFSKTIQILSAGIHGNMSQAALTYGRALEISDRITVNSDFASELGISEDMFVEHRRDRITRNRVHHIDFDLTPVSAFALFWTVGQNVGADEMALIY
jgi:hypothetical protein